MSTPTPVQILCAWCLKYFAWTAPTPKSSAPTYCCRTHKKHASEASKRFMTYFAPGQCPTPSKQVFRTSTEAASWLRAHPRSAGGVRVYKCNCGQFHIGHVKRHVETKEQAAISRRMQAEREATA